MSKRDAAIGALVLAVVALLLFYSLRQPTYSPSSNSSTNTGTSSSPSAASGANSAAQTSSLSYEQALAKYANSRIQFDSNCVAVPSYTTVRNNTNIMLDNRASVGRNITVNGVRHYIGAFGFKIVYLSYANLPKTVVINCGSGVGNAQVLVQH